MRVFYEKYKPWSLNEEEVSDDLIDVLFENIRLSFDEEIAKKLLSHDAKK